MAFSMICAMVRDNRTTANDGTFAFTPDIHAALDGEGLLVLEHRLSGSIKLRNFRGPRGRYASFYLSNAHGAVAISARGRLAVRCSNCEDPFVFCCLLQPPPSAQPAAAARISVSLHARGVVEIEGDAEVLYGPGYSGRVTLHLRTERAADIVRLVADAKAGLPLTSSYSSSSPAAGPSTASTSSVSAATGAPASPPMTPPKDSEATTAPISPVSVEPPAYTLEAPLPPPQPAAAAAVAAPPPAPQCRLPAATQAALMSEGLIYLLQDLPATKELQDYTSPGEKLRRFSTPPGRPIRGHAAVGVSSSRLVVFFDGAKNVDVPHWHQLRSAVQARQDPADPQLLLFEIFPSRFPNAIKGVVRIRAKVDDPAAVVKTLTDLQNR
ncbi:hypothetical protein HK405_007957 [Cladochytrium tenue]|nr:hypothetical protein HK405_007957 [Cladochytrium tenue]